MIDEHGNRRFACAHPDDAIRLLLERLPHVPHERIDLAHAVGRVLATDVVADRPSPPCDVSAMDGYAVSQVHDLHGSIPVVGEVQTGDAPPTLPAGSAMRIFTGGAVPAEAVAVIPREQTIEHPDHMTLREHVTVTPGQHIRRQGENAPAGAMVASAGSTITMPTMAALAAFGAHEPSVQQHVRIGVLITGDELVAVNERPEPWQIRDSNRWSLHAFIDALPWAVLHDCVNVPDNLDTLTAAMRSMLAECDALLLTGGVSMGDHDHVAASLQAVGAEELFHWLPIRPGKPMLGAIGEAGQPIIGLPGNPVSVMTTLRRFGLPILMRCAGITRAPGPTAIVTVRAPDEKSLPLYWYRPVRRLNGHEVELATNRGSGDLVSTVASDGFIEVKPGETAGADAPFYAWRPTEQS